MLQYVEWEFHRGLDIGMRICQELSGSANKHLHVASHMMAYQLRTMEKKRMNLLVKTMAVHSTVRRTGHLDNKLEESVKALIKDLQDQREQHAVLRIDQHGVELEIQLGTIWDHKKRKIEYHPRYKEQERGKNFDSDAEMSMERIPLWAGLRSPKWTWSVKRPTLTKSASCSSRDNRENLVAPRDDGKSPRGQD